MNGSVTFNENGYLIDGKPVWLLSGEMHYFKMTRGDWRRRLVQLKCAGFNTVSVYMPWNYHELNEGEWDFSSDRDVEYFLQLANELGLYVVARPGPYICNEWHAGGFPSWLSRHHGIRLRTKDPLFLSYVDKWWDKIAPIIKKYEIGNGGSVIMAQVENEYGHYGEFQEPDYVYHLRDGLLKHGIQVPIINCDSFINFSRLKPGIYDGINMCCNFGGDGIRTLKRARNLQQDKPLFVTEYWIAAFDWWGRNGSAEHPPARALNGALEIAAGGAGGLTAFVFAGGAHFGYWHGRSICSEANFMTTLYGPGAPVLDDGRFDQKYQLFKNMLSPLATAELADSGMPRTETMQNGITRLTRKAGDTEFLFYQNSSKEQIRVGDQEKDQACVDMTIPAGEISWTVKNLPLANSFVLSETNLKLFTVDSALVLYGKANQDFIIRLASDEITGKVPNDSAPFHQVVSDQNSKLDVLVLNEESVKQTWCISRPDQPTLILGGPDRIEDMNAGSITVSSQTRGPVWKLEDNQINTLQPTYQDIPESRTIALSDVTVSSELPESQPAFDDSSWHQAETPLPMAYFGAGYGWAWYRTTITVKDEGPQIIYLSGAEDRAHVYVDGNYLGKRGWGSNKGWHLMPSLTEGDHTLAILIENMGMFNSGAEFDIPLGEPKGLYGTVWMNSEPVTDWRMRCGLGATEGIDTWQQPGPSTWESMTDATVKGPVWLKSTFTIPEGLDAAVRLDLIKGSGKSTIWLNGKNIGRFWNLGPQESLWLPLSWLKPTNELVIFEEESVTPADITVSVNSFGPRAVI